ncbi:hypothetical protein LPJ66_007710 [Kickxella alabastrina]|uniref:Uncharacterized protein n=1 Tax=Kickxella alabastrina TaxID=61397 RepID=A0ACC1IAL5_9FUNG|nr:hypothetical protein LPJ66_007710 [Kickxella alabastrina]
MAKRARLDDDSSNVNNEHIGQPQEIIIDCQLIQDKKEIALPPGIGAISAIATWTRSRSCAASAGVGTDVGSSQQRVAEVAVGTDTGYTALIRDDGSTVGLENSGSPTIQRLLVKDPAMASGAKCLIPDVVSGDSEGRVSVYKNGRMISRNTLSAPVSAIVEDCNPHTQRSFIVGDMSGSVTTCHAQDILWRAQVYYPKQSSDRDSSDVGTGLELENSPEQGISSVCSVRFADDFGILTSYVLVASGGNSIQILSRGHPVLSVPVSAPCNCMCSGDFVPQKDRDAKYATAAEPSTSTQAMFGDDAGRLLVFDNFEMMPYAQVDYPVTSIATIPLRALANVDGPDVVVCATRSNVVYVLHAKKVVCTFTADFWPVAVDVILPSCSEMRPAIVIAENRVIENQKTAGFLHRFSLGLNVA